MPYGVQATPEECDAYRRGVCTQCRVNKHQAGSPMCSDCWPLRVPTFSYEQQATYWLTDDDIQFAQQLADEWVRVNKTNGAREMRRDGGSDDTITFNGIVAETAFAKFYGMQPNTRTVLIPHAPDFEIAGKTLDIKAVDKPDLNLIAPLHKRGYDADIYVLGVLDMTRRTVTFKGWETGARLISARSITPLWSKRMHRPVDTYVVDRNELRSMDTLEALLGLERA